MNCIILVIYLFCCSTVVKSAKILAIFPSPGYSQYFVGEPLLIQLARRGHEITLVSFHKPKQPINNIIPIEVRGLKAFNEERDVVKIFNQNIFIAIRNAFDEYSRLTTERILTDESVQQLIRSNATFDLVLLENVANEPLMTFSYHFKAPLVIFSTIGASEWINHLVANPAPFSYIPHTFSKFSTSMNIWERAHNFLAHLYSLYVKYFILVPKYNEIIKKHFGTVRSVEEFMYNASLVLLNSHPAATPAYPTTANMIEIGGFHIRSEVLPEDLEKFLDNSSNGVIYFSMGTNVDIKQLGEDKLNGVLKVFSNLKENVLWKFAEIIPGKPNNVEIRKWMPQRAILGHKNVKVFLSHCGLIGTMEAAYFGVPLICIPVFVDQSMNATLVTDNGVAITIHPHELNKQTLSEAFNKILTNKSYSEKAKQKSKFFRDAPIDPMDLATYWIEFVIRHKGAPHLRNPGLKLHWYQYYFLDVFGLLLSALLILYTFAFYINKYAGSLINKEKRQ